MVPIDFPVIMRYPVQLKQLLIYPTVFVIFYTFVFVLLNCRAHLTVF